MDHASNGSLSDVFKKIEEKKIFPSNYTNTSRQIILVGICFGMKYLHENKIIHRNLNPSNILLDFDFHPFITDFWKTDQISSQIYSIDKIAYVAPEILRKDKYDEKIDVYSFGILMYEILTDSKPFPILSKSEITDFEFEQKVINENFTPDLNKPMKQAHRRLIEQCLSRNPKKRPSFSELFEKLTNRNKDENYLLDKIYKKQFQNYVNKIINRVTSPIPIVIKSTYRIKISENQLKKIESIKSENQRLKEKFNNLESECEKKFNNIKIIDQHCQELEKDNEQLKVENDERSKKIEEIEKLLEELKKEMADLETENKQTDEKIDAFEKANIIYEKRITQIQKEQEEMKLKKEDEKKKQKLIKIDQMTILQYNNCSIKLQKSIANTLSNSDACKIKKTFEKIKKICDILKKFNEISE